MLRVWCGALREIQIVNTVHMDVANEKKKKWSNRIKTMQNDNINRKKKNQKTNERNKQTNKRAKIESTENTAENILCIRLYMRLRLDGIFIIYIVI